MLSIKVKMVFPTIFHVPKSTHLCGPLFNGLSIRRIYLCVKNKEDLFSWF